MRFGREDARRVGALAGLQLTEAELDGFPAQLDAVLSHVAALEDVASDGSPELPGPEGATRADVPGPDPLTRPPAEFAPVFADGFFVVPRLQAFDAAAPDPTDV